MFRTNLQSNDLLEAELGIRIFAAASKATGT